MITASPAGPKELEQLVIRNIPRDALMACEDAYYGGDEKGRMHSAVFSLGHRPSAAGQVKHFHTNEAFHEALQAHGGEPSPGPVTEAHRDGAVERDDGRDRKSVV